MSGSRVRVSSLPLNTKGLFLITESLDKDKLAMIEIAKSSSQLAVDVKALSLQKRLIQVAIDHLNEALKIIYQQEFNGEK